MTPSLGNPVICVSRRLTLEIQLVVTVRKQAQSLVATTHQGIRAGLSSVKPTKYGEIEVLAQVFP